MIKWFFTALFVFSALTSNFNAQASSTGTRTAKESSHNSIKFMPVSEVREGMKGTAKTVFRGTVPEEFNVEILGVVPGSIGPKQDMIIGRISGGSANRTSVFAGMSGSPVFIDGKLVGALSYSFPFSKEAICGITPIAQMIDIFENKPVQAVRNSARPVSYLEIAGFDWKSTFPGQAASSGALFAATSNPSLLALAGQSFQRIATPVSFNGFTQETLNQFSSQMTAVGLLPVASAGGAAPMSPMKKSDENTLVGGASVAMHLTRGDFSMTAAGTVTLRDGDKVYAFGHPFLGLGSSSLPMSESHVVTVIPNLNNSFKLAVPDALVGTMTQDRNTGVFGKLGVSPRMIPVQLNVQTSRNGLETYNFEVANDDFLTPILLNMTIFNGLTATERALGETMVTLNGEVAIKGQNPIKMERRFAGMQAAQFASSSVAGPINALLRAGFQETEITKVTLNLTSNDDAKTAVLQRLSLNRTEARPGDTFEVNAFLRTDEGRMIVQKIPVVVPRDTPTGTLLISVGDGGSLQRLSQTNQFVPGNLGELIKTINSVKKNDRLYVQAFRITNGAIIGSNELPNLPPSVLATLNNDRTVGGFTPTVLTALLEQEVAPSEFLVSGQQVLTIEIVK